MMKPAEAQDSTGVTRASLFKLRRARQVTMPSHINSV